MSDSFIDIINAKEKMRIVIKRIIDIAFIMLFVIYLPFILFRRFINDGYRDWALWVGIIGWIVVMYGWFFVKKKK